MSSNYMARGPLNSLAGSMKRPRSSPSTPSTAMPTRRNGKRTIHTSGYATSATSANGQQKTSRRHHSRNFSIRVNTHVSENGCTSRDHRRMFVFLEVQLEAELQLPSIVG